MKLNYFISMFVILGIATLAANIFAFKANGSEPTINENLVALNESDESRYPDLGGKPEKCTLLIIVNLDTGEVFKYEEGETIVLHPGFKYERFKIEGLRDLCPRENGPGCDPYSCQQVPY